MVIELSKNRRFSKNHQRKAKPIAQNMKLDDRIKSFPPFHAFITSKDHEERFRNHPSFRIGNSTK